MSEEQEQEKTEPAVGERIGVVLLQDDVVLLVGYGEYAGNDMAKLDNADGENVMMSLNSAPFDIAPEAVCRAFVDKRRAENPESVKDISMDTALLGTAIRESIEARPTAVVAVKELGNGDIRVELRFTPEETDAAIKAQLGAYYLSGLKGGQSNLPPPPAYVAIASQVYQLARMFADKPDVFLKGMMAFQEATKDDVKSVLVRSKPDEQDDSTTQQE